MLCCLAQDTEAVNLIRRWRAPGEMKCLELGFSASHPVQSSPSPRDTSDSSASSGIVDLVLWKSLAYISRKAWRLDARARARRRTWHQRSFPQWGKEGEEALERFEEQEPGHKLGRLSHRPREEIETIRELPRCNH